MNDQELLKEIIRLLKAQEAYQNLGMIDFRDKKFGFSLKNKWHIKGALDLIDWLKLELPELKKRMDDQ